MSDKTPKRNNSANLKTCSLSPVIISASPASVSPQKNLTGPPRIARDISADIYNNIQKWNDLHIKGSLIVKQIAILKSDDPKSFSPQLEEYINALYDVVQSLFVHRNCFDTFTSQIKALAKLKQNGPLFISLDAISLASLVEDISAAYREEFKAKELVLENIAYAKNKNEVMFYAAYWTYQCCITSEINFKLETLLVETGHRKII